MREDEGLQLQIYCGGLPPFSRLIQVDAAAEVDEDEVLCGGGGGGGARAAAEPREEEDDGKGENEERPKVVPIYKEKTDRVGARNEEAETWLSSYSDASIFGMVIKDKDPLGYD